MTKAMIWCKIDRGAQLYVSFFYNNKS